MRIGIEDKTKDIYNILEILNSHVNEEIKLEDVLIQMLSKNISSSDLLFLVLQKLKILGYLNGEGGIIKILNKISENEMKEITIEIDEKIGRDRKLFVTPLEIAKFYMCPRRLFLEKIVLSKQFKEETGRVWDGEVIHLAINIFIENYGKKDNEELISETANQTIEKFKDKTTLNEENVKEIIKTIYEMMKNEKFSKVFTEKSFESFKVGLAGTPDLICIKDDGGIVPIDIKLGTLSRMGIKEEHLLQSIGEAILVEDYFRKRVDYSYLIYFGSNSLVKVGFNDERKEKFIGYKKRIEKISSAPFIPEKSLVDNYRRRVCVGCHVKSACNNIEDLRRIYY